VGSFFTYQYLNILDLFLFIIAFPLAEMMFYNFLWKKRSPQALVEEG